MPVNAAAKLLQDFAKKHTPKWFGEENRDLPSDETVKTAFSQGTVIADHLCFPLQLVCEMDDGKESYLSVDLREIRRDGKELLFRCDTSASGDTRIFAGSRIKELYAGPEGTLYTDWERLVDPVEKMAMGLNKRFFSGTSWEVDQSNVIPSLSVFVELFSVFKNSKYLDLRRKLNLLLFLARADGRMCDSETKVVHKFIKDATHAHPNDRPFLMAYMGHAFVTVAIFREAVDELDSISPSEIREVIHAARDLIEADGKITGEEKELFKKLESELAG